MKLGGLLDVVVELNWHNQGYVCRWLEAIDSALINRWVINQARRTGFNCCFLRARSADRLMELEGVGHVGVMTEGVSLRVGVHVRGDVLIFVLGFEVSL